MTQIQYKSLATHLKSTVPSDFSSVYLLFGDEFLFKKGFQSILDLLLPKALQPMHYISLNAATDTVSLAMEEMNTFSLLSDKKVVGFHEARFFDGADKSEKLIEKAKECYDAEKTKKGAGHLLKWLSLKGASHNDLTGQFLKRAPFDSLKLSSTSRWITDLVHYIVDAQLKIPKAEDEVAYLMQSLDKGFPSGHHLIITTERIQKKHALYKAIAEKGVVVDCSVAKGQSRADKNAQKAMLLELFKKKLAQAKKKAPLQVFESIADLTGFDLRVFAQNVEKLISYAGDRPQITLDHVENVLTRSKIDPIFEFTNAITERNCERSLFYLSSLLKQNFASLQILSAMVNQFRKLIVIKSFILNNKGSGWHKNLGFEPFKSMVMSQLKASDLKFSDTLTKWNSLLKEREENGKKRAKRKGKKQSVTSDLLITKSITNPYPMYLMFKKSEKYTLTELLKIYEKLMKTDITLKTQGMNHQLILERVILFSCQTHFHTSAGRGEKRM